MVNLSGLVPIEMSLFKSHEHAIDAEAGYGPMFGAGHNLHISGNANINYNSHTFLGCSFQCPTGQNAKTFLAGQKYFTTNCNRSRSVRTSQMTNQISSPTLGTIRLVIHLQSFNLFVS